MYRMKITHSDIIIDHELESLLCPLSEDEFKALEDSIFADGLQDALKVWINPEDSKCYLVDGHNRYTIMDKYGKEIPHEKIAVLDNESYKTKDDVIFYMLQYQLGRRNLTEGQRIEYVLRYEEYFKKKGKQNQSFGGGDKKSVSPNLGKAIPEEEKIDTNAELAKMAGMSKEKFRQGKAVLKSDNEAVKGKYKRDEISTNRAYREVTGKDKVKKCLKCKQTKVISEFKDNRDFCNKCMKDIYKPIELRKQVNEKSDELTKFLKTERQSKDYTNASIELSSVFDGIKNSIEYANRKIFKDELDISESMTEDNIAYSVDRIEENKNILISLENKINDLGKVYPKTTADYDKEIADIEAEIAALYEMKTKFLQDRHKAFQADNSELRCECTEEHNATWSRYSFYLVKGESKVDLFTYFDDFFKNDYTEFMEDIERKLKYSKYSKLSKDEKAVITAKLVDMRETVKQDRQKQVKAEKVRDESFKQNLNQALGNLFRPQFNPAQKEVLKKIYKAGAKALHSDTNGGR